MFLVVGLGFITSTPARRISLPEARRFEQLHAEVYRDLGYELVEIEPAPLDERAARVRAHL